MSKEAANRLVSKLRERRATRPYAAHFDTWKAYIYRLLNGIQCFSPWNSQSGWVEMPQERVFCELIKGNIWQSGINVYRRWHLSAYNRYHWTCYSSGPSLLAIENLQLHQCFREGEHAMIHLGDRPSWASLDDKKIVLCSMFNHCEGYSNMGRNTNESRWQFPERLTFLCHHLADDAWTESTWELSTSLGELDVQPCGQGPRMQRLRARS